MKSNSIAVSADKLAAGQYLTLETNHIMNSKTLTLSFKADGLSEEDVIRLGHGESSYGGSYIELTKNTLSLYSYTTEKSKAAHGLTVSGAVNVTVSTRLSTADVTVTASDGMFVKKDLPWAGRNGAIFAVSTASELSGVRMRWFCSAYESDVWMLGDSYFNFGSRARWPYYLKENGYSDYLLMGYPGRNSQAGLEDFRKALTHGTPKYAIWCLGMNNGDTDRGINESYLSSVREFLGICEEKGVTPVLSTVPCTPTVNNFFKNEWVRGSGYRYIDFARAVGGEEIGSEWFDGMLYTDRVHPAELGAKALYGQFIADFPEILS